MELSDAVSIFVKFFLSDNLKKMKAPESHCHLKNVQVQVLQCFWNSEGINNELQLWWVYR